MTGMTSTEQILARHSGKASVKPGDWVVSKVDVLMTHDVCGPPTIGIFKQKFGKDAKVWNRNGIVIIPDHFVYTRDQLAHQNIKIIQDFGKEQGMPFVYDVGINTDELSPDSVLGPNYAGVCHTVLPEKAHTRPGEVLIGTDSHTCMAGGVNEFATGVGNTDAALVMGAGKILLKVPETFFFRLHGALRPGVMAKDLIVYTAGQITTDGATYQAMEFGGEGVSSLTIDDRLTTTNMGIELGAKNAIFPCDQQTLDYILARQKENNHFVTFEPVHPQSDTRYAKSLEIDLSKLEPFVAKPHSPDNVDTAANLRGVQLTRAYIGSCTGGKTSDFLAAAQILSDAGCPKTKIPLFIVPATTKIGKELHTTKVNGMSLYEIFNKSGAQFGPPSCMACLGGPADTFGRMGDTDIVISATNRNFPGRMGSKQAQVYLASPATVAASAVTGNITPPYEILPVRT